MADTHLMPTELQIILKLKVPVLVLVGQRSVPLEDVLALAPGAILELGRSADDELDLLVNNKPVAQGVAVKVGENFGIRVGQVADQRQRVEAMAAQ